MASDRQKLTTTLDPQVLRRLKWQAWHERTSLGTLLDEAVRQYLEVHQVPDDVDREQPLP